MARVTSVVGQTRSSMSVLRACVSSAHPPTAPGTFMRCLSLPSLPTTRQTRPISVDRRALTAITSLNTSAILPSIPGRSDGRWEVKSPSLKRRSAESRELEKARSAIPLPFTEAGLAGISSGDFSIISLMLALSSKPDSHGASSVSYSKVVCALGSRSGTAEATICTPKVVKSDRMMSVPVATSAHAIREIREWFPGDVAGGVRRRSGRLRSDHRHGWIHGDRGKQLRKRRRFDRHGSGGLVGERWWHLERRIRGRRTDRNRQRYGRSRWIHG